MVYYNEKIWVGTNNSLFQLSQDGWTEVAALDAVTQTKGVLDMVIGPQSRLWCCSRTRSPFLRVIHFFVVTRGSSARHCPWTPMFYEDSMASADANVWVYSDVGAEKYNFDAVEQDAFRGPEVFGLADRKTFVLSAVNLYRVDSDRRSLPEINAALPASELTAITRQPDQSFLLGSVNGTKDGELSHDLE